MDFDTAKENIQPLRQGRRIDRLEAAFGEQSKESLENERRQYEEAITSYDGHDPLSIWFEYICWIEQSFPKGGAECGLDEAVLKCIVHFENDQRYRQDRRMIKLFIKYIDTQKDPHELYNQLYNNGIGTLVADLYVAWSFYYDALNNYKQVETIFRKGFDAGAQPIEELSQAHQAFSISMSKRMLYDDEDSKKQFQVTMEEKRSALTSLRAHKKRHVGSIRTGIAVKHENPGIVYQEPIQSSETKKYEVLEHDDDAGAAALPSNTSVIRSIVDSSRKKENTHEPGPWNKAKMGKIGGLFGQLGTSVQPDFNIMEDDSLPFIPCPEKLFEKGIQLPSHWVSRNKAQQYWDVPVVIDEPVAQRVIPCYEKFFLYPNASTEISADEYRGYKWHKDRELSHPLTRMYDKIWINELENGIRLPPGFSSKNVPQIEKENFATFIADADSQNHLQIPFEKMVNGNEEKSTEELLADKFARGGIQLLTEADFEEIDAMDETIIGDRRQSVYPCSRMSFLPRKSIMPRKSVLMPTPLTEEDEEEAETPQVQFVAPSLGAIRKSLAKRKHVENYEQNMDDEKFCPSLKRENVSETPPRSVFKPPPPVEKKPTRLPNFEDEDPNDSCSTQQFNFFIKAQSVSTPVSKKLAAKAASEAFTETGKDVEEIVVSRASATPPDHVMPKQLSTIMETTETTQSTKSSVCDNDTVFNPKTPKDRQDIRAQVSQQEVEKLLYNNLITSFRLPEEQTETCTKIVMPTRAHFNTDSNLSNIKSATPAKSFRIAIPSSPALPIEILDSIPTQPSIISIKSSETEMSMKFSEPEVEKIGDSETSKVINSFMVPTTKIEFEIPATQEVTQLMVPDLENFEIPETQAFDIPATQDENTMVVPAINDSDVSMFPATQDFEVQSENFDVPTTQNASNLNIPPLHSENENFENPSTQEATKLEIPQLNRNTTMENFDIPATQEITQLDVPELDEFQLPETQQIVSQVEIPATQDSTMETQKINNPTTSTDANKPDVVSFCIYEDSVRENPGPAAQKFLPDDEGTGFLHISRKENLIIPPTISQRSASDEFLSLLASPIKNQSIMKDTSKAGYQGEISDMLKFSGHLESSLKNLSIEQPRSATPTNTFPNFMEDDLNTEKFSLALGNFKNSTLLCDFGKKSSLSNSDEFNLSIAMNEAEMEMLGLKSTLKPAEKPAEPEFKIPTIPMAKPQPKPAQKAVFKIFEDKEGVNEEEDDGDMSKSIYKPQLQYELEVEEQHEWSGEEMCSFIETPANRYEHTILEGSDISMKVQDEINKADGNPFDERVRQAMLDDCNFSQYLEEHVKTCKLLKKIPPIKPGVTISTYGDEFTVLKFIAKGTFGSIFTAKSASSNNIVALKQEKPPNLWEYYICIELLDRLKDKRMIPAFMKIDFAFIANNSSVLITPFSPYGTIIDVCNKHKNATYKNVDEYVVMVLTTQMLSIIDHLHAAKIIHADIKPDNFLVMSRIEFGNKTPSLQLIDFGTSIDMDWYSKGETFTTQVTTENFVCCEMQEGKPWTYQTDLFGLAGTVHVMLFGKYMTAEKKLQTWHIKSRYPRYFNKFLWDNFFTELLNIPDCSSMPNLQAMKDSFEEVLQSKKKYICDKISEFNQAIEM